MDCKNDIERIMELYGNSIYRMSYYILQNTQDAQDVLQETLIKYMQKSPQFQSESHEKSWLLRVANNLCKDMLRFRKRNQFLNLDELTDNISTLQSIPSGPSEPDNTSHLISLIFALPDKYKRTIYLHYYEGYTAKEIAVILKTSEGAVKKRLERGRNQLRRILEEK